jgi:SAM-dependent methyltransferase
MSNEEYERWETRFKTGSDYVFGTEPNYFLAASKPLLPRSGKALAIADGEGRNGVWLAQQRLDVVTTDFAPAGIEKAKRLAAKAGVKLDARLADMHTWDYPPDAFDVVADIFTQVSLPDERAKKWAGIRRTLKSGGLLVLQGYTPRQLEYGTGGPKLIGNLYTRAMLMETFGDFRDVRIVEEDVEMHEGPAHSGMSAVIGLTGWKR